MKQETIESIIYNKTGIILNDVELLHQALIHPSYANEVLHNNKHYERLEFMGDAALQCIMSKFLFELYPDYPEGELSITRANYVCEASLATFARELNLNEYIKIGIGETKRGGSDRDSIMANVFEAIIGAIYISNGYDDATKFLDFAFKIILDNKIPRIIDYKTKLQEYVQADTKRTVTYELIETKGTQNDPVFYFKVIMDNLVLGYGHGNSKKKAQQEAAKDALDKLVIE
ncbi:MAG: ribonuclease III [Bacilli bacterium]